jgi:hypothetical protein
MTHSLVEVVRTLEESKYLYRRVRTFAEIFGGEKTFEADTWVNCNYLWEGTQGFAIYLHGGSVGEHALPPIVTGSGKIPHHRFPYFQSSSLSQGDEFDYSAWKKSEQSQQDALVAGLQRAMAQLGGDVLVPEGNLRQAPQVLTSCQGEPYVVVMNEIQDHTEFSVRQGVPKEVFFCAMKKDYLVE